MIIVDFSNLAFSQVLDFHSKTKEQVDLQVVRNLCIKKLKQIKDKLKDYSADEIVLAFDSRHYWRKDIFPLYKANRGKARKVSTFDWNAFFPMYEQFKTELRDYFPVKCIEVDGAEADDIMAVLASRFGPHQDVCIVTSDNDMIQVQQHVCPRVKQWSPWHSKFLTPKNSDYDLFEHIVRGDAGDGVPNILSDDDSLADETKRQKSVSTKKLEEWKKYGITGSEYFCPNAEALERFARNRNLIDLRLIPEELSAKIVAEYDNAVAPKGKMFGYLTSQRLMQILKDGGF